MLQIIFFVSVSAAMAGCRPPTERVGKRKAEDEAPLQNKEPRPTSSTVKSRAVAMFIDFEKGLDIMRKSEANRAAAQMKNRRMTVDSGEVREANHPKRAKRAAIAALSDDDNGVFLFSLALHELDALYVTVIAYQSSCLALYRR